jgi:hypothetical protein
MPIPIEAYIEPQWVRIQERYPWVTDKNYKFANLTINPRTPVGRYQQGGQGAGLGWKAAGYNPNQNSTRVERVNITRDIVSLKPY